MTVKVICKSMNYKKVSLVIVFALLATQLVLALKSHAKDQATDAEFSKQIEASKAESQLERDKRLQAEKEAADFKAKLALLSEQLTNLGKQEAATKSHLETKAKYQEKVDQEILALKAQIKDLELRAGKREAELASAKQAEAKAVQSARDLETKGKAREANLLSQIESLGKTLDEKNERLEAAKRALNNTQVSK